MSDAGVRVDGARKLRSTLRAAGRGLDELKHAHAVAARIVAGAASPPILSGALASTVRSSGTNTAGIVRAGRKTVPYAAVHEYGWPRRGIAATAYLRTAAAATEPSWLPIYTDTVDHVLARVKGA